MAQIASRSAAQNPALHAVLGIPPEVFDEFMATAYQLYCDGRYAETEILCRGLLAADDQYWYPYSLYAAALQKMGRFDEALAQIDTGLRHEPGHPKLIALRSRIVRSAHRLKARITSHLSTAENTTSVSEGR